MKKSNIFAYIIIFLFLLLSCGSYVVVVASIIKVENNMFYIMASSMTYIVVISSLVFAFIVVMKRNNLSKPVDTLRKCARSVASGNYKIRVEGNYADEIKDLFDDFNLMISELESVDMLKNDFISKVSHELKTPIAVINNYALLLKSDEVKVEEKRKYLDYISEASSALVKMVNSILLLSKIENKKIVTNKTNVCISEVIASNLLNYETELENVNLEVNSDDIFISTDEELISIVISNLINNAIKYTKEDKRITINAFEDERGVVLEFIDNGIGISHEDLNRIFNKFYQGDSSKKGNGLGLTIVSEICAILDYTLEVESVLSKGSTFRLIIKK